MLVATPAELTATEFRILIYLAKRPGWVFTRQQIVDAAQADDSFVNDRFVTDRSVDVHIVSLRRKLGAAAPTSRRSGASATACRTMTGA